MYSNLVQRATASATTLGVEGTVKCTILLLGSVGGILFSSLNSEPQKEGATLEHSIWKEAAILRTVKSIRNAAMHRRSMVSSIIVVRINTRTCYITCYSSPSRPHKIRINV